MKLFRNAIILIVVVAVLAGTYVIMSKKQAGNSDVAEDSLYNDDTTIKVMSTDQDKISTLEFKNEKDSFKLTKKDSAWTMEPAMEFAVDNSIAGTSATDFSTVVAERVVEEKATDLTKYGLDNPATVTVISEDGKKKVLEIGGITPTKEGLYVKNQGENKVYLVGSYYNDKFKPTRNRYAVKDILPVDATTIKTVSFEKDGKVEFSFKVNSETDVKLLAPVSEDADTNETQKIVGSVVGLTIQEVVDFNPDLAKFGLDKPAYSIEYSDGSTTKKILFGKQLEKGKTAFAKFPEMKSVFTIDISALTFLDMKYSDLLNPFIYLTNISDVNKVELAIDGKTYVADINTVKDDSTKDTFKLDGKDANMKDEKTGDSLFRNFYSSMIGLTMAKYDPDYKPSGGTPEVTIKYYMKPDSKPVTIDLISKDANYYYAMKNGVYTNRILLKSKIGEAEGIRSTLKILQDAIAKQTK